RDATIEDCSLIRAMIRELAEFEHQLESVSITEEMLARDAFGRHPKFRALMAEGDGQPGAFALFSRRSSTSAGPGLHLDDRLVRYSGRMGQLAGEESSRSQRFVAASREKGFRPSIDHLRRSPGHRHLLRMD